MIWVRRTLLHSLAMIRDTHNGDREKSSGQAILFNIWIIRAMDKPSAQPEFVAQCAVIFWNSRLRTYSQPVFEFRQSAIILNDLQTGVWNSPWCTYCPRLLSFNPRILGENCLKISFEDVFPTINLFMECIAILLLIPTIVTYIYLIFRWDRCTTTVHASLRIMVDKTITENFKF